jgi:hypothetical protein
MSKEARQYAAYFFAVQVNIVYPILSGKTSETVSIAFDTATARRSGDADRVLRPGLGRSRMLIYNPEPTGRRSFAETAPPGRLRRRDDDIPFFCAL